MRRAPRPPLFPYTTLFRSSETKDAMDRNDIPYNLLAEEDGSRIAVYHSPLSREELGDYEDALKALTLACRSEEHTSELQSRLHLVCRLLHEKKKPNTPPPV